MLFEIRCLTRIAETSSPYKDYNINNVILWSLTCGNANVVLPVVFLRVNLKKRNKVKLRRVASKRCW